MNKIIQDKWKEGFVFGYDAITFGDGKIVIANTYRVYDSENKTSKQHWYPLCDTTLEGVQKYNKDVWVEVDVFHDAFSFQNQTFVFGDGGMGNEGFIASTTPNNMLKWAIFFTFSNPICRAEVIKEQLICYGDTGAIIKINLNNLTEIEVSHDPSYP